MSFSIPSALEMLASATKTIAAFAKWRQVTIGNSRSLINELETNSRYCWAVIDQDIPVGNIVGQLSTTEYDRLNKAGFDFNNIRQRRIYRYKSLAGTDLAFLGGQETKTLIKNIYDRIKDLKTKYPFASDGTKKRWQTRVVNIQKRILLLLRHVRAETQ